MNISQMSIDDPLRYLSTSPPKMNSLTVPRINPGPPRRKSTVTLSSPDKTPGPSRSSSTEKPPNISVELDPKSPKLYVDQTRPDSELPSRCSSETGVFSTKSLDVAVQSKEAQVDEIMDRFRSAIDKKGKTQVIIL